MILFVCASMHIRQLRFWRETSRYVWRCAAKLNFLIEVLTNLALCRLYAPNMQSHRHSYPLRTKPRPDEQSLGQHPLNPQESLISLNSAGLPQPVEREKENVLNNDVMLSAHFPLPSPNKQKHHQEQFARTPITSASPELQRREVMRKIEIDAEIHLPPPTDFIVSSSNSSSTDTLNSHNTETSSSGESSIIGTDSGTASSTSESTSSSSSSAESSESSGSTTTLTNVLDSEYFIDPSTLQAYLEPETALVQTSGIIPTKSQTIFAYHSFSESQTDRSLRFREKLMHFTITAESLQVAPPSPIAAPSLSFQAMTQPRIQTWLSGLQRKTFIHQLGNYKLKFRVFLFLPSATPEDKKVIDEVTSVQPLAEGGFKRIFDAGNGLVIQEFCTRNEYIGRELIVNALSSALNILCPNFPRMSSEALHAPAVYDDRKQRVYTMMPRLAVNLYDYLGRFVGKEEEMSKILISIAMQIGFGVLAGQSVLNLLFGDLKSLNVMLDGDCIHKFYLISVGCMVFVFESNTEAGFGTVKLIDNSTTHVASSYQNPCHVTTPILTPLDAFLPCRDCSGGFPRDVHNIMLLVIEMFSVGALYALWKLEVPEGFELLLEEGEFTSQFPNVLYQQLVLLSKPGECILDVLSRDPTFAQNPTFQAVKQLNGKLWKGKAFAKDVSAFSLLEGTEFFQLRKLLGNDKVQLLWKGMAPNFALRPTLLAFMFAFFGDSVTKIEPPEEELRHWYAENAMEETEIIPLFLNERHVEILFGDDKDSFMLKGDRQNRH